MVFAGMPGPLSSMTIDAALHGDRDDRRDLGLLAGVERVVDEFLEHHQRPFARRRGRSG